MMSGAKQDADSPDARQRLARLYLLNIDYEPSQIANVLGEDSDLRSYFLPDFDYSSDPLCRRAKLC